MACLLLLATPLCLLASGCARYQPRPLVAQAVADEFESRSLRAPELVSSIGTLLPTTPACEPPDCWSFASLTVAALYYHPDLELARATWKTYEAARITAAESPNPTLSVSPAFDTTQAVPSPWVVTAVFDLPIETAGKRTDRMERAEHLSDAARLGITSTAWQVRTRLRHALLALFAARERIAILSRQQANQRHVVDLLDAQLREGAVSPFEVTQARLVLDRSTLELKDAERRYAEARANVAAAIGVTIAALDDVRLSLDEFAQPLPPLVTPDVRRTALLSRSDVLAALAEYAASESALRLEIAKQYPDIHLDPGYEFDQGDNKWALGLTLTLPLINQNQGPIAEAESLRRESAVRFEGLQARVIAEIEHAEASYLGASAQAGTAARLVADAERKQAIVASMIEAGEVPGLTLYTTRLELDQNTLALLDARVAAQDALGGLEDAVQRPLGSTGFPWQPPSQGDLDHDG